MLGESSNLFFLKTKTMAKKTPIKKQSSSPKTTKVQFIKSPTGKFGLGYDVEAIATFEATQAKELIDAKYAVQVK